MNSLFQLKKSTLALLALPLLFSLGCKKDRLTSNTYQFAISPSATSVAKNNPRTFVLDGVSSNVEAAWQVLEPAAAATIVPPIGASVEVTFPNTGVYTLVADFEDKRATAQIRVENSTSPSTQAPLDNFLIYTDAGIPLNSHLFTNLVNPQIAEQIGALDAPEGSKYMRTDLIGSKFWMVDLLPSSVNLADYPAGTLKFSIRLSRPLIMGDNLKIEMEQLGGGKNGVLVGANWNGFNSADTNWQSVSIDLSLFFAGNAAVRSPFIFSCILGTSMTVDIDNVRLEKP